MEIDDGKRRGWLVLAGAAAVSFVLLLWGYAGAYFELVEPQKRNFVSFDGPSTESADAEIHFIVVPKYRYGGEMPAVFYPMLSLDREWIRPKAWEQDSTLDFEVEYEP